MGAAGGFDTRPGPRGHMRRQIAAFAHSRVEQDHHFGVLGQCGRDEFDAAFAEHTVLLRAFGRSMRKKIRRSMTLRGLLS